MRGGPIYIDEPSQKCVPAVGIICIAVQRSNAKRAPLLAKSTITRTLKSHLSSPTLFQPNGCTSMTVAVLRLLPST